MKRISLQWRITLMTVLLIGVTCVAMNLLLCFSGVYYMDTIVDGLQGTPDDKHIVGAAAGLRHLHMSAAAGARLMTEHCALRSSAIRTAPPAAPLNVLCERPTNL